MDIRAYLSESIRPGRKYAVMGIGSELRSDDAAGMHVAKILGETARDSGVLVIQGSTAPENFTGVIKRYRPDKLFLVDAAMMGSPPGEIGVVPAGDIGGISFSTHMLPLPILLNYLKLEIGCEVVFIGIQPKCTDQGLSMCGEVKSAAELLAAEFQRALSNAANLRQPRQDDLSK